METNLYQYYLKRRRAPRAAEREAAYGAAIGDASGVARIVRGILGKDEPREHFFALFLDVRNQVVGYEHNGTGSETCVWANPRELFRAALLAGAVSIILSHNHPSGNSAPSAADDHLTEAIGDMARIIGIPMLDHVIVTERNFYSYAENGRIKK